MIQDRITPAQAAQHIGISERSVWSRIKDGTLVSERDGQRRWLSMSDAQRYKRSLRKTKQQPAELTSQATAWMGEIASDAATLQDLLRDARGDPTHQVSLLRVAELLAARVGLVADRAHVLLSGHARRRSDADWFGMTG